MFLKTDPNLPHHYIIGIGIYNDLRKENLGKLYLKYVPLYFHNKDVENLSNAMLLMDDKMYTEIYKTSRKELLEVNECLELVNTISSLKFAAKANNVTLHHFSTETEIETPEEFFEGFIQRANVRGSREVTLLKESIIN
jgi:hypothetical protein